MISERTSCVLKCRPLRRSHTLGVRQRKPLFLYLRLSASLRPRDGHHRYERSCEGLPGNGIRLCRFARTMHHTSGRAKNPPFRVGVATRELENKVRRDFDPLPPELRQCGPRASRREPGGHIDKSGNEHCHERGSGRRGRTKIETTMPLS